MERIFFDLLSFAEKFTMLGFNYYIAIGVFALCMVSALVGLLVYYVDSKTNAFSVGLFVFYQAAFIINVALCLCESVFCGKFFHTTASAYAFCFSQYAICLIFWIMLYKDKKVTSKNAEKPNDKSCTNCAKCSIIDLYGDLLADLKSKNEALRDEGNNKAWHFEERPVRYSKNNYWHDDETEYVSDDDDDYPINVDSKDLSDNPADYKLPDVNVAYVSNLINALMSKNIQPDEREKLQELSLRLKSLPTDCAGISELNGLLRFLLKKIAEYDIPA